VRRELLALPVELLFCDRALPLDDQRLRQAAAGALLDACGTAFAELLGGGDAEALADAKERQNALRTLAEWLRALRKALRLLPVHDPATPLRVLAAQGERLMALTSAAPAEASEVVQQLARWKQSGCEKELTTLLRPLLECLFAASNAEDCQAMLPLLADLAAGCWPRAVLGDFDLDWHAIAVQALAAIRIAVEGGGAGGEYADGDATDAEAALAVWQTFAATVREGTRSTPDQLDQLPGLTGSKHERPEKRSRLCDDEEDWHASPERIADCEALPQLFGLFARELLELLRAPPDPEDSEGLLALRDVREAAQTTLAAWGALVGQAPAWQEATWAPLQQVGARLTANAGGPLTESDWRDAEAVLWFSAALAESCPAAAKGVEGGAPPPAAAVPELGVVLDTAPEPWRALLWSASASLAATVPAEQSQRLLEWALQRPPMAVCALDLLQLVELPYAEALERLCRHVPGSGAALAPVGERLAALAFEQRPSTALHEDSVKAQGLMLRAMRHAMGSDAALLCQGLAQKIVPALCSASEAEAEAAPAESDPPWRAAQALFATLAATLPTEAAASAGSEHPAVALWRERWPYVEAALLRWKPSDASDQPLAAACEALAQAAQALPALLPEALQLLAKSVAQRDLPQIQLQALREVTATASCTATQELLVGTVLAAVDTLLAQQEILVASPATLTELFKLLGNERIRSLLVAQPAAGGRCLQFVILALPDCTSAEAASAMLRFTAGLAGNQEELDANEAHRSMLVAALPTLCAAVCRALATHEHLAELDDGLRGAAEFFLRYTDALPEQLPQALAAGLANAQVGEWSGARLQRLVAARADWPRLGEWLDQLQQIACEWQRERRRVAF